MWVYVDRDIYITWIYEYFTVYFAAFFVWRIKLPTPAVAADAWVG